MGSVGCYTQPSIGNSDALFSLDAGTGVAHWIYRTESIEQYHDSTPFYHDFGFLNGPLLVDASDGRGGTRRLVVGPSKDGTVYAVDPVTGALVWSESLVTNGSFAGFGLFNAAAAWANDTLYTSLYETIIQTGRTPTTTSTPRRPRRHTALVGADPGRAGPPSPTRMAHHRRHRGRRRVLRLRRASALTLPSPASSGATVADGVATNGSGNAFGLP
jgi:hypothetical protein